MIALSEGDVIWAITNEGKKVCCVCDKKVPAPAIHWDLRGPSTLLVFHPRCALLFGTHLIKDAAEVQQRSLDLGGKGYEPIFPNFPMGEVQ